MDPSGFVLTWFDCIKHWALLDSYGKDTSNLLTEQRSAIRGSDSRPIVARARFYLESTKRLEYLENLATHTKNFMTSCFYLQDPI